MRAGSKIEIRIEFESGLKRAGVLPLCRLAESLPGIELNGLMTYRSATFPDAQNRTREEVAREEGELLVEVAEEMRAQNVEIKELSGGSTPTGKIAAAVNGVSEVRPGTYVFNDVRLHALGAWRSTPIAHLRFFAPLSAVPQVGSLLLMAAQKPFAAIGGRAVSEWKAMRAAQEKMRP